MRYTKFSLGMGLVLCSLVGIVVNLAGCGGGSGTGGVATRSAKVALFATDSFRDDYDHIWATIFAVDLIKADGSTVNTFQSTTGLVIDLRTLHDATGARFSFLGNASVTDGTYTGIKVTLGPTLTLFAKNSTTGTSTPVAASLPRDANGNAVIALPFAASHEIGNAPSNVVVDFDLANFAISGGQVVPKVKEGDSTGISDSFRHEEEDYSGTVGALSGTSPTFSFTIQNGSNTAISVTTDATTTIFNASALPSPVLSNGQRVEIRGKFDVTSKTLSATSVKIEDSGSSSGNSHEVKGAPSAPNSTAGTFTLTATNVRGFVPGQTSVTVATTSTTIFRGDSGVTLVASDFFTRLATATSVEVEGTYDLTSNTVTATRVKIDNQGSSSGNGNQGREAEAKGTVTTPLVSSGTFVLSPVSEFDGFALSGTTLNVATTTSTTFKNASGNTVTSTAFFALLTATAHVEVKGTFTASGLTATSVKIDN